MKNGKVEMNLNKVPFDLVSRVERNLQWSCDRDNCRCDNF